MYIHIIYKYNTPDYSLQFFCAEATHNTDAYRGVVEMKMGRVHQRKSTDNGGCSSYLFLAAISLMVCLMSADGHSAEVQHASSWLKIELGENWREMPKNVPVKFMPTPTFAGSHELQEPS